MKKEKNEKKEKKEKKEIKEIKEKNEKKKESPIYRKTYARQQEGYRPSIKIDILYRNLR